MRTTSNTTLAHLSRSNERAFTLIEMLAVIAVIGVLLSIIMPTISGIRKEALSVSCQANLRSLFTAVDTYGPEGGLVEVLGKTIDTDCTCWFCVADDDEEGSIETGTSYLYVPGLLRYTPQVQIQVAALMMATAADLSLTQRQRDRIRREAEAKLVGALYERNPSMFAVLSDSQDRHKIGTRNPRNGVYIDGSVGILRDIDETP